MLKSLTCAQVSFEIAKSVMINDLKKKKMFTVD